MLNTISRRLFLLGSSAAIALTGTGLGSSSVPAFAEVPRSAIGPAGTSPCREEHPRIMEELGGWLKDPDNLSGTWSHAAKTAQCSHCGTRIGYDPALV